MEAAREIVVRYGEISLKGANRSWFERQLMANLKDALRGVPGVEVRRSRGRMFVRADQPAAAWAERAARVFGVESVSPATRVEAEPGALAAAAVEQVAEVLASDFQRPGEVRFRVRVNRADKRFPMSSADLERAIAHQVMPRNPRLKVDLAHAELSLEVDLRDDGCWMFAHRLAGPGGLPVGTVGRAMCLLSGGIDSPVAAWQTMKRGVRVELVSFYSFPYVGPQTREKIVRLAECLAAWQPITQLHLVPFADYQVAIRDHCPAAYRTVLYRRAMQRIATHLAFGRKCRALVTGESLGQVASQTMSNLATIEEASGMPVLRPLIGLDKQEIIARARAIGSYRLSSLPAPDCCTVFQPESPVLHGQVHEARAAEEALDLETLTKDAVRGTERLKFPESS